MAKFSPLSLSKLGKDRGFTIPFPYPKQEHNPNAPSPPNMTQVQTHPPLTHQLKTLGKTNLKASAHQRGVSSPKNGPIKPKTPPKIILSRRRDVSRTSTIAHCEALLKAQLLLTSFNKNRPTPMELRASERPFQDKKLSCDQSTQKKGWRHLVSGSNRLR